MLWDVFCVKKKKVTRYSEIPTCFFSVTVEADEEMKAKESRGLNEDEKTEKPSEAMSSLDEGLSTIANLMTDEVNA